MIRKRLILADKEELLLDGLERLVEDDYDVVGRAHTLKQLMDMARRRSADVMVVSDEIIGPSTLGAKRAGGPGSTLVSMAHDAGLKTKIVALTTSEDVDAAIGALTAGINGYLLKRAAPVELLPALREAELGNCWISPVIASKVIVSQAAATTAAGPHEQRVARTLSPRQRRIVTLIVSGKIAKEVAADIGISRKTVEYHKYKVMKRLGLTSTADLIRFAVRNGLDEKPQVTAE